MAYTVHLSRFDGPLDLLLHLIHEAKIDIRDIFVSQITDQYLETIGDLSELDMDAASEFLTMAATLLEIKSRTLLPKPPEPEDEFEETPEEALIRRLEEYEALKRSVTQMQEFEKAASRMFEKLPEEVPVPPPVFELPNLTLEGLAEAFRRVLERFAQAPASDAPVRELPRDRFTVHGCMIAILSRVRRRPCAFDMLFSEAPTREEIVTLFMALLELIRTGRVSVGQDDPYGEIMVSARKSDG